MRRRVLLHSLALPALLGGCMAPNGQPPAPVAPPAGATMVRAAYPPLGATWRVRVTEAGLFHQTAEERDVTAAQVDLAGRRGYGLVTATTTHVLDPVSFNPIGTLAGGKVVTEDTPEVALFSWPLWVGKAWDATNARTDFAYGATWAPAGSHTRVTAFEDVTVPAGTFKAFRIEYQGGIGSTVPDHWRNPGRLGFETLATYWYAPGPKLIVRSDVARLNTNYRWAGRTTTELLTVPR